MELTKEYSTEFDQRRLNRIKTSFYKYGSAEMNFGQGLVRAIETAVKCMDKYRDTGNTEYLLDAANYLMFEYMYPQHENAHFKATESHESAGIVGMSINEMEDYNGRQNRN